MVFHTPFNSLLSAVLGSVSTGALKKYEVILNSNTFALAKLANTKAYPGLTLHFRRNSRYSSTFFIWRLGDCTNIIRRGLT